MKPISLFNVFMSDRARRNVAETLETDALGRMTITQGPKVEEFEAALERVLATPYPPLTTNSCTSALALALRLAGVNEGDEVISTPMTCTATSAAIVSRGARIVWADVDAKTGLIDPADVHRKMNPATKAIVAVDWAGSLADYRTLKSFGVPVIEDAAHAFLAVRDGYGEKNNAGDYVCWSFGAIKHLTAGDGGALLTPPDVYERARLLRWYGLDRRTNVSFRVGQNVAESALKMNMNDINAAIGLGNLESAPNVVRLHREHADYYNRRISPEWPRIDIPPLDPGSAWWLYCLRVDQPQRFIDFMRERGVECGQVHGRNDKHHAYAFYSGPLPGVDAFASHEVAIPVGWWLGPEDLGRIANEVERYSSSGG